MNWDKVIKKRIKTSEKNRKGNTVSKPPKWTQVYPQGTPAGDEEQRFFISLERHKKFIFRSVAQLAKETRLTKERIEQIIQKYARRNMVFQNPKNEDQWGYWERCPKLLKSDEISLSRKDQKDRMEKSEEK